MLALFHYTLRQQGTLTYQPVSLTPDEQLSSGVVQWRTRESRPLRVLTSSKGSQQRQNMAGGASATSLKTSEEETEISATSQREKTVTTVTSEPGIVRVVQRHKPLPQFNIDSLLPTNNDSAFLPPIESRHKLASQPPATLFRKSQSSNLHLPSRKKLHLSSDDILPSRTPGGGYVVVLKVYEQQTMASGNLLQLQCWASMLNMSVVTPFMKLSNMVTPLDEARQRAHLSIWDTLNKTHWHEHTKAHGYLPLVEWEDWLKRAPRKLIVVQFKHPLLSRVKEKKKQGIEFPHPLSGDAYSKGCEFKFVSGKALTFLKANDFIIVRKVCFNFRNGDGFTFSEFQEHLFGNFKPGQVSVLLDMWRGLNEPQRVLIMDKICREEHPFREQVQPSSRLLHDVQTYKDRFLGPDDYIAVITRFEMTGLSRQHEMPNDTHAEIPRCITKTLYQLNQLRADTGIENTFLSIDIGKYGSSSFAKKKYYHHLPEMIEFVRKVYRGRMVMSDIEHTLEQVSRTTDAGYIASLQQLIVTRAKCILFVGGGSFQRHALHMYQELHPDIEDQCIRVVESCTNPSRPIT
jgi:hypothetical protein